jgi:hypothetical protein
MINHLEKFRTNAYLVSFAITRCIRVESSKITQRVNLKSIKTTKIFKRLIIIIYWKEIMPSFGGFFL